MGWEADVVKKCKENTNRGRCHLFRVGNVPLCYIVFQSILKYLDYVTKPE